MILMSVPDKYFSKKSILKYLNDISEVCMQNCEFEAYDNLISIIQEIESEEDLSLDVIDLVRCKDCIYYTTKRNAYLQWICCCKDIRTNRTGELYPLRNDYCRYGKRKE